MSQVSLQPYKVSGDIPAARFGHTLTQCGKKKAVLFGGAIGDSGKFVITNECYMIDFVTQNWVKLNQTGNIPSQRAAHAACMIEQNQIVVFGGAASGGGGLSGDDLFLLDLRQNQLSPQWIVIPTQGQTPGKRYGHSMVFFKPYLIVFGGNTGTQPVNDVWILNVEKAPYQWQQYKNENNGPWPQVRVYHSASLCQTGSANGMMVIFGGRTQDQSALNDTWGLRKHRDGKWDWVQAPYKNTQQQQLPLCRYQHWITFIGPLMLVLGGRTNVSDDIQHTMEIYDTESSDWYKVQAINRYRHTVLVQDNQLILHGGFEPEQPNKPLDSMITLNLSDISNIHQQLAKVLGIKQQQQNSLLPQQVQQQQPQFQNQQELQNSNYNQKQQQLQQQNTNVLQERSLNNQTFNSKNNDALRSITPMKKQQNRVMNKAQAPQNQKQQVIRLSEQAIVATTYEPDQENNGYIRKVNIMSLAEESKKLVTEPQVDPNHNNVGNNENLCQLFIKNLLRPKEWKPTDLRVPFKKELIIKLCEKVTEIMETQNTLIRLRVPLKVFGSIHGRFNELLRFFDNYGIPYDEDFLENGTNNYDIEKFDYLFLGNYCDRGFNSIETLCLLFALKIKFPESIHLLRGAHEDRRMNKVYGLGEECAIRLNEDINDPNSVYQKFNQAFDMMPLAALVENKILCTSCGIGKKIQTIDDIENIQRPISNLWDSYNQEANELLWTQYVEQEIITHANINKDIFKSNQVQKFGEVKLRQFLNDNNLNMVIRSNTPCQEGFETNATGTIMTVFSCADYGGKFQNSGACLKLTKQSQIIPCTIQPTMLKQGTWLTPETTLKTTIKFTEQEQRIKKREMTPPKRTLATKI